MDRYERLWERLLTLLGTLGEVEEGPDRLVLTIDGARLEVVMTEKQWDDLVGIPYGSFTWAAGAALHGITSAIGQELPFLVYDTYELHPSATPELPDDTDDLTRRVEEARRANPDATFGWYAYRPDRDESP
jgi:hypothetical protein